MKRFSVIRILLNNCFEDNDVVIVVGDGLCKEAFKYDRPGNMYLTDACDIAPSLSLGVAMTTDKRVFVVCEDDVFLKSFNSLTNLAVSKCKNLFYILLGSGRYQHSGGQLTILESITSLKGVLFNLGFLVHDYTNNFKNTDMVKDVGKIMSKAQGPMITMIDIEPGTNKNVLDITLTKEQLRDRLYTFVNNTELGTSLFKAATVQSQVFDGG